MTRFSNEQAPSLDLMIQTLKQLDMNTELLSLGESAWIGFHKFIETIGGGRNMVGYIHPKQEDGRDFFYFCSSFETEGHNCLLTHTLTLPTTLDSEELCRQVSQYVQDMSSIVDNTKFRKMWLEQSDEMKTQEPVRYRVYDFPNGFRNESENMYKWLLHAGFTPVWDFGVRNGSHCSGITIPEYEVSQLKLLQRTHPARWGSERDDMVRIDPQPSNENVVNAPAAKTRMRP